MAVSALELRPRGPLSLFDAAIRLCSRSAGVWLLTLPGGTLVTAAVLYLLDAISHHRPLAWPAMLLGAAWFARGALQGAACHFLEQQVLGVSAPTARGSLRAALRRLPSLVISVAYLLFFNLFSLVLSLGLSLFFFGSHLVGYAVTMHGKGHPLALYGTCSKLLGPARSSAVWVRMLYWIQVLVVLNLHIAASVLIYLGTHLLGLDLTFAARFTSLDNPEWVAAVIALGFTFFEPLRAATATLLLIDGRVRQEGLDLIAALEQLPQRRAKKTPLLQSAGLGLLLCVALALAPAFAAAQPQAETRPPLEGEGALDTSSLIAESQLESRLSKLVEVCQVERPALANQLAAAGELSGTERASLSRFLFELEGYAYDDFDCDYAKARLVSGLPLIVQARDASHPTASAESARERAEAILARAEFGSSPEPDAPKAEASGFAQAWDDFWRAISEWLKGARKTDRSRSDFNLPTGGDGGGMVANVLVVALVGAVLVALVYLLMRARKGNTSGELDPGTGVLEAPLPSDPMSALSRPPEGWAHLADELAGRGEFREAVRSLYLALLSRLHRDGAIDYDPARSNWDYFRGFKGRREWVPPFRELTLRFDFAYYGNLGVGLEGFRTFRELTQPLLTASSVTPEDPSGA